jgi:hypothetical protein
VVLKALPSSTIRRRESMLRTAAKKVAWVGRTASMVFGLALVLALLFGVATMAFAANGNNFVLGVLDNTATAVTKLTGNVDGPALQVVNNNADANDTALDLRVQAGEAPMRVNSSAKVAALNADRLDGQDSTTLWSGKTYTTISEETGIANDTRYVQRSCDTGDKALSGGYSYSLPGDYQVVQDLVYNNLYQMGWHSGNTAVTAFVYITCADFGSPHVS